MTRMLHVDTTIEEISQQPRNIVNREISSSKVVFIENYTAARLYIIFTL